MACKKENKALNLEEKMEKKLKNDWMHLENKIKFIPEPTIKFKINQKVFIGNLKDCTVEKELEDGKIYLIDYTNVDHNYGNPIETPNSKRYAVWQDMHTGDIGISDFAKKDDIRISYHQTNLEGLLHKVYSFGVDFNPSYQRDHVWSLEDKIALIDSIYNNVDIGKFSFIYNEDDKWRDTGFAFEVLDGKQRLTALCEFYEGRFEYKGFKFRDLSPIDRNHFENYNVNVGEVRNATEKEIIEYFIKLNTHGRVMDKEHLEKVKTMIQ